MNFAQSCSCAPVPQQRPRDTLMLCSVNSSQSGNAQFSSGFPSFPTATLQPVPMLFRLLSLSFRRTVTNAETPGAGFFVFFRADFRHRPRRASCFDRLKAGILQVPKTRPKLNTHDKLSCSVQVNFDRHRHGGNFAQMLHEETDTGHARPCGNTDSSARKFSKSTGSDALLYGVMSFLLPSWKTDTRANGTQ